MTEREGEEEEEMECRRLIRSASWPPSLTIRSSLLQPKPRSMKRIQEYLGHFGPFQAFIYALCFVPSFLGGSETLVYNWTGYTPDVRCCVAAIDGAACNATVYATNYTHMFVSDDKCQFCDKMELNSTRQCKRSSPDVRSCVDNSVVWDSEYDYFPQNLGREHTLVCNKAWAKQLIWSVYTVGVGFGAAIFGSLSDKIGRRQTFLLCSFLFIATTNLAVISSNFWVYFVFQFIMGCVGYGTYLTIFIVFMEFVDGLPRTLCGIWFQAIFTLGMLWDAAFAIAFKDWRVLQFAAGAPALFLLSYYWLMPESVRWSILNGRQEEAKKVIRQAARWNKVNIPEDVLHEETSALEDIPSESILSLFSHWRLAKNTLIVFFYWMAASMCYYGLAQNTGDLPGSPFVTYTLSALSEFPGYIICVPMMQYWGRRPTLVSFFVVGGVACIAVGILNDGSTNKYLVLSLALLGKMCVAVSFAVIYNYSAEMFPTVVRQSGTGFSSVMARVGSLLAPQIRLLGDYVAPWLPFVVYGSVGLTAGILAIFLPETRNQQLPETIEDGINFGVRGRRESMEKPLTNGVKGEQISLSAIKKR